MSSATTALGLATVNTLVAVVAGADGVQVIVNGFGERAGNAALEEVVARTLSPGLKTGVRLELPTSVSRLVQDKFGVKLALNKPIVGENAFYTFTAC